MLAPSTFVEPAVVIYWTEYGNVNFEDCTVKYVVWFKRVFFTDRLII